MIDRGRIRVGIIGAGGVADYGHLPGVRAAGGEVVGIADREGRKAREMAERCGVATWHDSHRPLIADPGVDVVAICTPSASHHAIATDALRGGKHVYLEKPPTESAEQMADVARVAEETGRCLLAGSHHPCRENVTHLRDRIVGGELGRVYAIESRKLRSGSIPHDDPTVTRHGGVGSGSTIHRIDVTLHLLGNPAVHSVTARTFSHFVQRQAERSGRRTSGLVDDTMIAQVTFADGCVLTLRDMGESHLPLPAVSHWLFGAYTVFGTDAVAELHPLKLFRKDAAGAVAVEMPAVDARLDAGHAPTYRHLFACIRVGRRPEGSAERAVASMRLLDAMYASAAESGRQVVL
jgi:predicted dehydrogenase